ISREGSAGRPISQSGSPDGRGPVSGRSAGGSVAPPLMTLPIEAPGNHDRSDDASGVAALPKILIIGECSMKTPLTRRDTLKLAAAGVAAPLLSALPVTAAGAEPSTFQRTGRAGIGSRIKQAHVTPTPTTPYSCHT